MGSFVAPLVLVAVASSCNWRWAFFLAGVPGLIMALLIPKFVRQPAATATPAQTAAPLAESSMGYGEMLQHRNMWLCMLMAIFMVAWMVLGWAFLPLFYTKVRQISNGQMSVLMSVLGLSAAFFSFVVPALSDRFGRRPVIVIFNFIGLLVPLAALHFQGSLFMLGTLISLAGLPVGPFHCSWARCRRKPFRLATWRLHSAWWWDWVRYWAASVHRQLPAALPITMVCGRPS
jgi:predicted MFS family arabinose efflux permease